MKKLFLTSGIIACMACPAFAAIDTTYGAGFPATNGTVTDNGTGDCVNDVIGTYSESTTLVAQWIRNYGVMALNENDGSTTAAGGSSTGTTYDSTGTNYSLFLTPYNSETGAGAGVYKRTGSTEADYAFTLQAAGANVISAPTGIDVTYNRTDTLPTGASTSVTTASTSTTLNRTFLGYYANGTTNSTIDDTTNQYINANGNLTQNGVTAAATYNNNTPWVALYALVSPVVTDPAAYGYNFNGWYVDGGNTVVPTDSLPGNIGEDTALVADWSPVTYAVSYSCGNGTGTPSVASNTATFDQPYTWAANNDTTTGTQNCHKDGYHFTGWTCTANAATGGTTTILNNGGTGYTDGTNPATYNGVAVDGGTWTFAGLSATGATGTAVSCVAQYAQNTITISWTDPEGGNTTTTNSCTYEGDVSIPADPARTGYVFDGWQVQQ